MSEIKLEEFMRDADIFFGKLLSDRSYNVQEKANVSSDCIGYRCLKNGRFFTVYMYAFGEEQISQLDGEFCSQLWDNPLSKDSTVLVAYLQVKRTASGPQICDYTGNPKGLINFCQLTTIKDKPVLLYFPSERMHELFYKFVTAFNTDNTDLYHTILTPINCYVHGYDVPGYFTNDAVYHSLRQFHKEHGKMKIGYVRFNDVVYSRVAYLDGLGYFGISVTDDHEYIQGIQYYRFNNPKILEFIKTDEESIYSVSNIPLATKIVPLAPIQSERFAMKIYYKNGECRKYALPEDSTDEIVSYDGHLFTDKMWKNGKLVQTHKSPIRDYPDGGQAIEFINGYYLPIVECYERGTPYTEPTLRNEIVYQDNEMKITKLWDWEVQSIWEDNGWLSDEEDEKGTGILKVLISGSSFNWHGCSTLMHKDGTRCSLDFYYLDSSNRGWFNVGLYGRGYNYIDSKFKFLNRHYYNQSYEFAGKYARVTKDNERFYITRDGKEIHPKPSNPDTKYTRIENFCEGLALVSTLNLNLFNIAFYSEHEDLAGTWGYIDESGKEIIEPQYIYAESFEKGMAIVCKGKWENKKWPHKDHYCEGYWSEEEKWGAIDKQGKEVIPFIFDEITHFNYNDDVLKVHYGGWKDGKFGIIDRKGNWIVKPIFDYIGYEYENDMFTFSNDEYDEQYGLYDAKAQKIILENKYSNIDFLADGNICYEITDPKTEKTISKVIDRNGKEIFSAECSYLFYVTTSDKKRQYYELNGENGRGLVDIKTGKFVVECDKKWDSFYFDEQLIRFEKDGKKGICDFDGKVIVEPKYDDVREDSYNRNFYEVKLGKDYMKDARYGLIKRDGTVFVPPKYLRADICRDSKHIICEEESGCSFLRIDGI